MVNTLRDAPKKVFRSGDILPEPEDLIPLAESAYERILRKMDLKGKQGRKSGDKDR